MFPFMVKFGHRAFESTFNCRYVVVSSHDIVACFLCIRFVISLRGNSGTFRVATFHHIDTIFAYRDDVYTVTNDATEESSG